MINDEVRVFKDRQEARVTDSHEWTANSSLLIQQNSTFLAPGAGFKEHNFSTDWLGRWFRDEFSTCSVVHFISLLLHQLHLWPSGTRSWSLGTPALTHLSATHLTSASYTQVWTSSVFFHLLPCCTTSHWSLHYTLISIFAWECSREGKGETQINEFHLCQSSQCPSLPLASKYQVF